MNANPFVLLCNPLKSGLFHAGERDLKYDPQELERTVVPEYTVLVVDDDPKIRNLLRNVLEDDGFGVQEAATAADVTKALLQGNISLITLDVHLGKDNGVDLARDIRRTSQVPIIMVTGKDDVIDRIVGLEVGADDYITKPFHIREVTARIRSVLRRAGPNEPVTQQDRSDYVQQATKPSCRFYFDGMTAIPDEMHLIDRNNEDCELTSGDFKLLKVFLERPKRVLSRDHLMNLIGGTEWNPLDRTIDNQVARLRKKIERDPSNPKLIKTVRGVGYTLACDIEKRHPPEASSKGS